MHPSVYAAVLKARLDEHPVQVWLVNTGWTGGPYGVGQRMELATTRALIRAALGGALGAGQMAEEPVFGLRYPTSCPGVADDILDARGAWPDAAAYDEQANRLALMFADNFAQYADAVDPAVLAAGPRMC
jgi:phosphoenolpyruvate carboxykinase (ATP)